MTQDEEIISNISYTNSDFRSIYPQLLDTAKKLTNKWDPSLSNESDPGNILIKEAAIVGDKVNYHIDKNVLECFPLSATQQASARQLYDLVGYNMHWYKSAEGSISFKLIKQVENVSTIIIDAGTTVIDNSGEYAYTLLKPTQAIVNTNTLYYAPAIQGIIEQYKINGNATITIDNLDENLRLYFPQNIISENGIFVYNDGANPSQIGYTNDVLDNTGASWFLTDNLTKHPAGSKVFKFGLDINTNSCYIEFPSDIVTSDLIGSGLNVYYTSTLGADGNIKQGIINKFLSSYSVKNDDDTDTVPVNDYLIVSNSVMSGGQNPESLEEAYRNYKKLIGTYDTLVTRRDYENAIYKLENNNTPIVSNSVITDKTCDHNFSQKVVVGSLDNTYTKNFIKENNNKELLNSYDVILYLLNYPTNIQTVEDYDNSFKPDLSQNTLLLTKTKLEEYKSIQHNLEYITGVQNSGKTPSGLYFDINNVCKLTGTLTTYYKVSETEAKEIQDNVTKALVNMYNARAIDFGNALDYNDLITTIKNADDRIRNLSLNTPAYEPILQFADGTTKKDLYSGASDTEEINNETLAKMILAGNVQLFQFQKDFQYDFGQVNGEIIHNVASISTSNSITISANINNTDISSITPLNENDFIQIIAPNLFAKETYSSSVKYAANFSITPSDLIDGCMFNIPENGKLKLIYYENGVSNCTLKTSGELVKLTGISSITAAGYADDSPDWEDTIHYTNRLTAGQSIEILSQSQLTIKTNTPYYVISNSKTADTTQYKIHLDANTSYILQDNEYLLYTNSTLEGLVILGSGTSLTSATSIDLVSNILELEDVLTTEVSDTQTKWNLLPNDIVAQENTIINLTTGDKVRLISTDDTDTFTCSNDFTDIKTSQNHVTGIEYKLSSEDTPKTISIVSVPNFAYTIQVRSNLILTGNSVVYQKLVGNQQIIFKDIDNQNLGNAQANDCLLYSYPLNITGGTSVDVRVLDTTTGKYKVDLDVYLYQLSGTTVPSRSEDTDNSIKVTSNITLPFTFNETVAPENTDIDNDEYSYYLLPISANVVAGDTITITLPSGMHVADSLSLGSSNTYSIPSSTTTENISVSKILVIENTTGSEKDNLQVSFTTSNTSVSEYTYIKLGYLKQISGLNSEEINSENIVNYYYSYDILDNNRYSNVLAKINTLPGHENFYFYYEVPSSNKVLQPISGEAYFNPNHVYNKCTIAKIDFDKSSIKVDPSSIK